MTIRRAPDDLRDSFTIIDNRTLGNKDLSWEARGMLSYLLSKPSTWTVQPNSLIQQSPSAKRDKVYEILNELESLGYLKSQQIHDDAGRFVKVERWVYELPQVVQKVVQEVAPVEASETWIAAERLCTVLNERIQANNFKAFVVNKTAIATMERLLRLDNHTEAEVLMMIEWCQRDEFWLTNIRSPEKLRKHYDTMLAKLGKTTPMAPKLVQPTKDWEKEMEERAKVAVPMPKGFKEILKAHG